MYTHTWVHSYEHTKHSYTPAYTTTHGPPHNNVTNHSDLPSSSTVVMVLLEPKAALNAFKPASVTSVSPVWVCQQSIRVPTRSATHLIPTPKQPAGAARRQHLLVRHCSHKHTAPGPIFWPSTRACTPTHDTTHANTLTTKAYCRASLW